MTKRGKRIHNVVIRSPWAGGHLLPSKQKLKNDTKVYKKRQRNRGEGLTGGSEKKRSVSCSGANAAGASRLRKGVIKKKEVKRKRRKEH